MIRDCQEPWSDVRGPLETGWIKDALTRRHQVEDPSDASADEEVADFGERQFMGVMVRLLTRKYGCGT
jgi:hypothetical protein